MNLRFLNRFKKPADAPPAESAVERYFAALELELKRRTGVVPEEGLADARRYLERELAAGGPGLSDQELAARLLAGFGPPVEAADKYEALVEDVQVRPGYAPGWRVFCPVCRRSAPAAHAGVIRVGAWSWGKRMLAYCRKCRHLRWLRLVKDLDKPTLTRTLGLRRGEQGEKAGPRA